MADSTDGKRWLRYGCFGCLGVIGFVALCGATVFSIAWMQSRGEVIEETVLSPDLPAAGSPVATGAEAEPDVVVEESAPPPGKVVFEFNAGEFTVRPARSGQPLEVRGSFDHKSYELVEALETAPDGSWTYRIGFRRVGTGLLIQIKEMITGNKPKLELLLPTDIPMALDFDIAQGGGEVELGGLWLTEVDLNFHQAGGFLSVDEPLREPVDRFALQASMAGFAVQRLGNASPRKLELDLSMGGIDLDLRGEWVTDSEVTLRYTMSGCAVHLPEGVRFVGLQDRGFEVEPQAEVPLPTMTFSISGKPEDIEFID